MLLDDRSDCRQAEPPTSTQEEEEVIDLRDPATDVASIRTALGLSPHPEGGSYRETWRDTPADPTARGVATSILFLLARGEESARHRVDAAEFWLWHAGAPLALWLGEAASPRRLGPDTRKGEALQGVVPAHVWQSARTLGAWTLVSCVVAPAFRFEGFELSPVS